MAGAVSGRLPPTQLCTFLAGRGLESHQTDAAPPPPLIIFLRAPLVMTVTRAVTVCYFFMNDDFRSTSVPSSMCIPVRSATISTPCMRLLVSRPWIGRCPVRFFCFLSNSCFFHSVFLFWALRLVRFPLFLLMSYLYY